MFESRHCSQEFKRHHCILQSNIGTMQGLSWSPGKQNPWKEYYLLRCCCLVFLQLLMAITRMKSKRWPHACNEGTGLYHRKSRRTKSVHRAGAVGIVSERCYLNLAWKLMRIFRLLHWRGFKKNPIVVHFIRMVYPPASARNERASRKLSSAALLRARNSSLWLRP